MHQSVNILQDCIILAFLGIKNQNYLGGHVRTPPYMKRDINIIFRNTITLQDYRSVRGTRAS